MVRKSIFLTSCLVVLSSLTVHAMEELYNLRIRGMEELYKREPDPLYKKFISLQRCYEKDAKSGSLIKKAINRLSPDKLKTLKYCISPFRGINTATTDEIYQAIKQYRDSHHKYLHQDWNRKKRPTSVMLAVKEGSVNVLMILLAMKASPFIRYAIEARLPIFYACSDYCNSEIFKLLYWSMKKQGLNRHIFENEEYLLLLAWVDNRYSYRNIIFEDTKEIEEIYRFCKINDEINNLNDENLLKYNQMLQYDYQEHIELLCAK